MTLGMCTATLLTDAMGATEADVRAAGEAARAAGITEVSVWQHQIAPLEGLGLHVAVIEAAMAWASATPEVAAAEAAHLEAMVEKVGATKLAAVTMEPDLPDMGAARENLAGLVEAATRAGAQVCVEFLPWSGIPDLATAWELVEPLGPGAGILLDTWHWTRQEGGPDLELLARIPGERIGYVQLCDAAPEPAGDSMTEAMSARLLPGDGVVDFGSVRAALDAIGATPFVATEIFNPRLVAELGAEAAARAMVETAEAAFRSPRSGRG